MKAVRVLEYGGHLVRDILTPTIARDEVLVKIRCGRGVEGHAGNHSKRSRTARLCCEWPSIRSSTVR
jgi:hypothetical protein